MSYRRGSPQIPGSWPWPDYAEELCDGLRIELPSKGRVGEKLLTSQANSNKVPVLGVEQRTDANPVLGKQQRAFWLASVPHSKGKLPVQVFDDTTPMLFVEINDYLGVRPGLKGMALGLQVV